MKHTIKNTVNNTVKNTVKNNGRQLSFWVGLILVVFCVWVLSGERAADRQGVSTDDCEIAAANIDRFGFTVREIVSPTLRVTPLRIFSAPLPSTR